jgi:hypothetical protein
MEIGSIAWGAALGFVSSYAGQKIVHAQVYRLAAREGHTLLRHVPYVRAVQLVSVPLGALLSWTTGVVWSALLAGPTAGTLMALPPTLALLFHRGRDHRRCADDDLPIAEAFERELARRSVQRPARQDPERGKPRDAR